MPDAYRTYNVLLKFSSTVTCWLVCIGCILVVLSGCGQPTPNADGSAPPSLHELAIGTLTPITTLSPLTAVYSSQTNFMDFAWAGLVEPNASGILIPILAKTVPSQSNGLVTGNGRSITFLLKPGLRWSDGRALTAADVVFGWQLAVRSRAVLCPAVCGSIGNVATAGTRRVTFQLKHPYSPLLFDLPPVLPKHQLWKGSWAATFRYMYGAGVNFLSKRFAVDGPYQPVSSSTSQVSFVRNPHWTALGRPAFARVVIRVYKTDTAMLAAEKSGAIEISQGYSLTDFFRGTLTPQNTKGLQVHLLPEGGIEHLEPNLGREPLNQPRVRQALSLDINRTELVEQALGISPSEAAKLAWFSPESAGRFDGIAVKGAWDPLRNRFESGPHPGDAARLLTMAGWKLRSDGFRYRGNCSATVVGCELTVQLFAPWKDPVRFQESLSLIAMWNTLGVKTVLVNTWPIGSMLSSFQENGACSRGYDNLCLFAQNPEYDPQTDYSLEFTSNHVARWKAHPTSVDINYAGVNDSVLNRIFAVAPTTYNLAARAQLYGEWQTRVVRLAYWIVLFARPETVITRSPLRNFSPTPTAVEWNPWALAPK